MKRFGLILAVVVILLALTAMVPNEEPTSRQRGPISQPVTVSSPAPQQVEAAPAPVAQPTPTKDPCIINIPTVEPMPAYPAPGAGADTGYPAP